MRWQEDHDHLLWTDDYLAAFAQATEAELVTLDRVFRTRYPAVRVIDLLQWSASERVGALASGRNASAR